MSFTVVYDANVLFPAPLRDLLIRLAQTGLVRARWTEMILDECFRNLRLRRPDLSEQALSRTRALMNAAVRDCLVSGFEDLVDGLADLAPGTVASVITKQAADLKNPPHTREQLLETLFSNGLTRSTAKLKELG